MVLQSYGTTEYEATSDLRLRQVDQVVDVPMPALARARQEVTVPKTNGRKVPQQRVADLVGRQIACAGRVAHKTPGQRTRTMAGHRRTHVGVHPRLNADGPTTLETAEGDIHLLLHADAQDVRATLVAVSDYDQRPSLGETTDLHEPAFTLAGPHMADQRGSSDTLHCPHPLGSGQWRAYAVGGGADQRRTSP